MNLKNKKILVTGGKGFLGKHVIAELINIGCKPEDIYITSSKKDDLRKISVCKRVVQDKDIVIHLAGVVGGIGFNQEKPGELFYDNLLMGIQLMDEARKAGVKKFITSGTVCSYPKITEVPFKETDIWKGYPEETNAPYGIAKKALLVQSQSYRSQYKFNSIHVVLANLYGPGDNFSDLSSHVIPALIKKVINAKKMGSSVEVWGTGKASREFLYVKDAARAIALALQKYDGSDPVNIGTGREIKIKDLVQMISKILDYKGKIVWNKTKPDGQPRRSLNTSRAKKYFGFTAKTRLEDGLKETIEWYEKTIK